MNYTMNDVKNKGLDSMLGKLNVETGNHVLKNIYHSNLGSLQLQNGFLEGYSRNDGLEGRLSNYVVMGDEALVHKPIQASLASEDVQRGRLERIPYTVSALPVNTSSAKEHVEAVYILAQDENVAQTVRQQLPTQSYEVTVLSEEDEPRSQYTAIIKKDPTLSGVYSVQGNDGTSVSSTRGGLSLALNLFGSNGEKSSYIN